MNNPAIDTFIIQATLIDPIADILKKLDSGDFRDCDLAWLNKKLDGFVDFAAKTLGINGVMSPPESVQPKYMNSYAVEYYSKYLNQLLAYFKSFNE